jgi:hypothetical protein
VNDKPCARVWEVEAARTGQLIGPRLHAMHEHLEHGCRDCEREARYFSNLTDALEEPDLPDDEIALRRLRQATLERAHRLRSADDARSPWRARISGVCLGLAVIWEFMRIASPGALLVTVTPRATSDTWHQYRERDVEHVVLSEGVFSLAVQRKGSDSRVLVAIPEGEIEDLGTTFSVTVHAGQTTRIAVSEGTVLVRRHGWPELRLGSGSTWEPASSLTVSRPAATTPKLDSLIVEPPVLLPASKPTHRPHTKARVRDDAHATLELPAEDEAYLQLVLFLRQGRNGDAKLSATSYLRDFPSGFRRADVERILHAVSSHE